jgi:hypothetical protein
MAYTFNNQYSIADTAQIDAFGRTRTSETTSLLALNHVYSLQDDLETSSIVGGGASVFSDGLSGVTLQILLSGDHVIRQSRCSAPYQPGKSQIFEASFSNMTVDFGVTKRIGAFDSDTSGDFSTGLDGFFLESDGFTHSFNIYSGGNLVVQEGADNWLTSDYNYADIDWTQSQLMMVDYQWLGVGRVRFYMVMEGIPRLFYEYTHANNANKSAGVYMLRPNKPIRYEIRATGALGSSELVQICSQISTEGSLNDLYKTVSLLQPDTDTLVKSKDWGLMGFRLAAGYSGVKAYMKNFSLVQLGGKNISCAIKIIRNPGFKTAFTWNQIPDTPIEYAIPVSGNDVSGSDGIEMYTYIANASFSDSGPLNIGDSAYSTGFSIEGVADEFWLCARPLGTNTSFAVAMNVEFYD